MIARETCPRCQGHGHIWDGEDVRVCPVCKSDGTVPARDKAGRFVSDKRDGCEPSEASHK